MSPDSSREGGSAFDLPELIAAARLEAYRVVVDSTGSGAAVIDGSMADRATDRHARVVLRQAVAIGRFDPRQAHRLGVIDAAELEQLKIEGVDR